MLDNPFVDQTNWIDAISLSYADEDGSPITKIGIDNGVSSTNDMITLEGTFDLAWLRLEADGDLRINLSGDTPEARADAYWFKFGAVQYMPTYDFETILIDQSLFQDNNQILDSFQTSFEGGKTTISRISDEQTKFVIPGNFTIDKEKSGVVETQVGNHFGLVLDNLEDIDLGETDFVEGKVDYFGSDFADRMFAGNFWAVKVHGGKGGIFHWRQGS